MTTTTRSTEDTDVQETCEWCGGTEDLDTFRNGWDRGELLTLCGPCLRREEPDACAEHRSGCNGREHTHTAEAL